MATSKEALGSAGIAYGTAEQANRIQVQQASGTWGVRQARINSVSPGIISTAMGRLELESPSGAFMRAMVERSGTGRLGTPSDIADAVTYLLGPQASFITGIDLLVDGGAVAAVRSERVSLPGRRPGGTRAGEHSHFAIPASRSPAECRSAVDASMQKLKGRPWTIARAAADSE